MSENENEKTMERRSGLDYIWIGLYMDWIGLVLDERKRDFELLSVWIIFICRYSSVVL